MSQFDTGLGWSAESEWLMNSHGIGAIIGTLKDVYVSQNGNRWQPIPITGRLPQDVVSNGVVVYETSDYAFYLGAEEGNCFWGIKNTNSYESSGTWYHFVNVYVMGDSQNSWITSAILNKNSGGVSLSFESQLAYYQGSGAGIRFYGPYQNPIGSTISGTGLSTDGPSTPNSLTELINLVHSDLVGTYYKLNRGYAVTCWAKWYDTLGNTFLSPILISTSRDAVSISADGSTVSPFMDVVKYKHDGLFFYMSMIAGINPNYGITSAQPIADLRQLAASAVKKVFKVLVSDSYADVVATTTIDPYEEESDEDGGDGEGLPDDEDIEDSDLPTSSFAATGFCRIYRSDLQSLRDLAAYMWTDSTFLATLKNKALQLFEDPMDAIITLNMFPFSLHGHYGSAVGVSVMYIPTGVAMWPMTQQFVSVDCGEAYIPKVRASALDYNPYTRIRLFLPFIGTVELDPDEVIGKTIHVKYKVDVVSGVCVAVVMADNDARYQFAGHCAIPMPLSASDFTGYLQAILGIGGALVGASMAAGAPTQGGTLLEPPVVDAGGRTVSSVTRKERNPATGRLVTASQETTETTREGRQATYGELAKRVSPNVVGAVINSKMGIEHSSGFSANTGYLGVRYPFITLITPRYCNPSQYGTLNGRPSMIYLKLGDCNGYTEVQSIKFSGISATNPELSELSTLLKSGVFL